jgi:uncharacterized membrane protein
MFHFFQKNSPRFFLNDKETEILEARISQFEEKTACELVFHFRRKLGDEPLARARELFEKFNLQKTTHRNAILITIALKDRKFAIWADEGVIRHTGDKLWHDVKDHMSHLLKNGQRLQALIHAVAEAENVLASEQPRFKDSLKNEISNSPIIEDDK